MKVRRAAVSAAASAGADANDAVRRGAARLATLVAVPVALAVAVISLAGLGVFDHPPSAAPAPSTILAPATGAVPMSAPALAPDHAQICRALVAGLPDAIHERRRRPVTGGAEQNAAYGDPPLTLECGAAAPTYPPTAQVNGLSGVCWYARTAAAGTVWTTVDRDVPVRVIVPGEAAGSAQSVIPFAAAIIAADPPAADIPTGCNP